MLRPYRGILQLGYSRNDQRVLTTPLVLSSVVLGLEMRLLPDGRLRFFVPETGEYLLTFGESEQERVREKERADRERARAERARADRFAAKLLELGIDPDQLN